MAANGLHLAKKITWHFGNGQAQRIFELREGNQHRNAVGKANDDAHGDKAHQVAQAEDSHQH